MTAQPVLIPTNRISLPVPPSSNLYWRSTGISDKRTGKPRAITYKTAEAKKYCQNVQRIALAAGFMPYPKGVDVVFHLIWYRENMRGDLSNRVKCLEDAMQGILYANDRQVRAMHTEWILDRESPRVEVWVERYEEEETP